MKYLIDAILEIASENPNGFTVRLSNLEFISSGIVCAYKETQNCFDVKGLEVVLNHATNHENIVGGWLDEESNLFYFDSCKIFEDQQQAVKFAKENSQLAVFDLTNFKEIRC